MLPDVVSRALAHSVLPLRTTRSRAEIDPSQPLVLFPTRETISAARRWHRESRPADCLSTPTAGLEEGGCLRNYGLQNIPSHITPPPNYCLVIELGPCIGPFLKKLCL